MTPGESVASTGELIWGKRSMALYKEWGDNVAFESKKGELNAKIRWVPLKNTLKKTGKMIETYNPTYMTYIENNDARGLLNYIDSEKDKKDDEKHNKTKKEKSKMLEINKLYSDLCKKLLKEGREDVRPVVIVEPEGLAGNLLNAVPEVATVLAQRE